MSLTVLLRATSHFDDQDCAGLQDCRSGLVGGLLPGGIHVKGISGGEARRLSIACALLGEPRILFLDEPTSGESQKSQPHKKP